MLASMVVLSHTHLLAGIDVSEFIAQYGLGNMAVMSFFVLSGFVIAEAYFTFYSGRPGAFIINRLLRIWPPFFVALVFSMLLHWSVTQYVELRFFDNIAHPEKIFSWVNITGNSLYLIVIYGLGKFGLTPDYLFVRYAWAVAVELIFYYIFTVAVVLSGLSFVAKYFAKKVYWIVVSAGICLLFFMAIFAHMNIFLYGAWVPYFLLGVSMYFLSVETKNRPLWQLIFGVSLVGINWHAFGYISRNPANSAFVSLIILNVLIGILWILSQQESSGKWKTLDRWFGDITYPLYLNHYAISIAILSLVGNGYRSPVLFVVVYGLCVLVSYGLLFISEPLTRGLRNRIRGATL
jgi:peptidoglycan/LPS O-acetylase OafA/YrhL